MPINRTSVYNLLIVQPAVNFDPISSNGIAWFVGKGDPGTNQGNIYYGRLQWSYGNGVWTPSFLETTWSLNVAVPDAYYDLDNNASFQIPQKPVTNSTDTVRRLAGSRLQMAVIRNGNLWTCHHVGLDGGDELYNGGTVDRTAVGWMKLKITSTNTLVIQRSDGGDYGRIYDTASTTPYYYFHPSLMINSDNHVLAGFSGSNTNEFIGAFYSGRRANDSAFSKPYLIQAGRDYFDNQAWGDYSYTSLDTDGLSFWTIQQYAEKGIDPQGLPDQMHGLWIMKVNKN